MAKKNESAVSKKEMSAKEKAFEDALKLVNSKIESEVGVAISKLGDRPMDVEVIPTGSLVLDGILGGGMPKGRLIEVYGPEASGKTSIALTAIGNVQRNGGTAVFIDLENALDPKYAAKLGVDVANLAVAQPESAEQTFDLVDLLASSGAVDIIVVDSVAALVPKQELEGTMDQQSMALVARLLSRALKKLVGVANRSGTTVIFINQLREKVGFVLGNPENTTGGKALKYFASQRIDVRRKGQVKEGKDIIGNLVKLKVVKNKIAPPFAEGETVLTFGHGINREAEMIEVGPNYDVIIKPNSRSYFERGADTAFGKSKAEAVQALKDDPELFQRLSIALSEAIEKRIEDPNFDTSSDTAEEPVEAETEEA